MRWVRGLLFTCVLAAVVGLTTPAWGQQTYVGVPPPNVGSAEVGAPVVERPAVTAQSRVTTQAASVRFLALTGADILGLLVLAGGCVGVGLLVRSAARRPSSRSS